MDPTPDAVLGEDMAMEGLPVWDALSVVDEFLDWATERPGIDGEGDDSAGIA